MNKRVALNLIKSKLLVLLAEARKERIDEINGDTVEGTWGRQVRNYVLDPMERVKDLRSGYETADARGVLEGEMDDILGSVLGMSAI